MAVLAEPIVPYLKYNLAIRFIMSVNKRVFSIYLRMRITKIVKFYESDKSPSHINVDSSHINVYFYTFQAAETSHLPMIPSISSWRAGFSSGQCISISAEQSAGAKIPSAKI